MGKKSSAPAPAPDPRIGQAAVMQGQLGKEWFDASQVQYADQKERLKGQDELLNKVIGADLASQEQANKWAIEDRNKYGAWADADRAAGRAAMGKLDSIADQASADGAKYSAVFDKMATDQSAFGAEERDRYTKTFRPVQDKLAADAMGWDSAERLESESGKARASVLSSAASQQEANARRMASMGIDPRSARFSGIEREGDLNTALAATGAQNMSRDTVLNQAQMLRGQAAQVGQSVLANGQQATGMGLQATSASQAAQLAGQSTAMQANSAGLAAAGIGNTTASMGSGSAYAGLGLGLNAGSSAVGAMQSGNQAQIAAGGIQSQGFAGAMQGYSGMGAGLNSLYGSQLSGWQAQQQASQAKANGIGSLVGTIGGLALKAAPMFLPSSKDYKEDKQPVSGALDALTSMPVEAWKYKQGIADEGEHIGPYAEDFHKATGKGDGKSIPIQDAIGVTMKAVQELSDKVDAQARKKKGK